MSNGIDPTPNAKLPRLTVGLDYSEVGEEDEEWGDIYNEQLLENLDEQLVMADSVAKISEYTPYNDTLYYATDTGELFVGDGVDWKAAAIELRIKSLEETVAEHDHSGNHGESDEIAPRRAAIEEKLKVPEYNSAADAAADAGLIVDNEENRLIYKRE